MGEPLPPALADALRSGVRPAVGAALAAALAEGRAPGDLVSGATAWMLDACRLELRGERWVRAFCALAALPDLGRAAGPEAVTDGLASVLDLLAVSRPSPPRGTRPRPQWSEPLGRALADAVARADLERAEGLCLGAARGLGFPDPAWLTACLAHPRGWGVGAQAVQALGLAGPAFPGSADALRRAGLRAVVPLRPLPRPARPDPRPALLERSLRALSAGGGFRGLDALALAELAAWTAERGGESTAVASLAELLLGDRGAREDGGEDEEPRARRDLGGGGRPAGPAAGRRAPGPGPADGEVEAALAELAGVDALPGFGTLHAFGARVARLRRASGGIADLAGRALLSSRPRWPRARTASSRLGKSRA